MSASASIPGTETPEQTRKRLRKVAAATIFGSMLEWYDFYLYATMAAIVFSKIFFDNSDPKTATLMAFSTFAIGFIARPFGGILFGYLGDKFGRKQVLVLTFCLMGVCTTLIGLIPSYASIGIWAPILLVFIRIIQGLGAGAELSGAAVTSYEHASQGKRGSQGAWPALGLNLGLLLSSLTIYLLTINGNEFLLAGGWRIPFICSIVLVGVGLWVRNSIPETPQFEALSKEKPEPSHRPSRPCSRTTSRASPWCFCRDWLQRPELHLQDLLPGVPDPIQRRGRACHLAVGDHRQPGSHRRRALLRLAV